MGADNQVAIFKINFLVLQETDASVSTDEISHMPEVEQHLIHDVDGKDYY